MNSIPRRILALFIMIASAIAFSPVTQTSRALNIVLGKHQLGPAQTALYYLPNKQIDDSFSTTNEAPVLVVGATGKIGRQLVYKLIEQNIPVRALVRNPEKAGELFFEYLGGRSSLDLVVCDLDNTDPKCVEEATEGCGCVINVSGKQHEIFQKQSQESINS